MRVPRMPEAWGVARVARELGVQPPNVYKLQGLPPARYGPDKPIPYWSESRQWLAREIRDFRDKRDATAA